MVFIYLPDLSTMLLVKFKSMTYEEKVLREFDVEFGKMYDIEQLKSVEELNKKTGSDFIAYPRNERLKSFISSALKKQQEDIFSVLECKNCGKPFDDTFRINGESF